MGHSVVYGAIENLVDQGEAHRGLAQNHKGAHQVTAETFLKELESRKVDSPRLSKGLLKEIFWLNTEILTPEQNFRLGQALYDVRLNPYGYSQLLGAAGSSSPLVAGRVPIFSLAFDEQAKINFISDKIFSFLQTAARSSHLEARKKLVSMATSRIQKKEGLQPLPLSEYTSNDDLFKRKSFKDFLNAVRALTKGNALDPIREFKKGENPALSFMPFTMDTKESQQRAAAVILEELDFKKGAPLKLSNKLLNSLFKFKPEFLTPEQNFALGRDLFSIRSYSRCYDQLLSYAKLAPDNEEKESLLEVFDQSREARFISNRIFAFLQTAAASNNIDARELSVSIALHKTLVQLHPLSNLAEYTSNDDLFKKKTFKEFLSAAHASRKIDQFEQKQKAKQEKKTTHSFALFHHGKQKSFDDVFEDLRKEFSAILETEEFVKSIEAIIAKESSAGDQANKRVEIKQSLREVKELFSPGLDKELNSDFANQLSAALLRLPQELQVHFDPVINGLSIFVGLSSRP